MADFIYKDYSCTLKFGEHEFELPLNEQTADLLDKAFDNELLPPKFEGIADLDAFFNKVMDAIDTVLGDGAADKIMSRFKHAGSMEAMSVVNYISSEWNARYSAMFEEMKKTANIPNRETRRATEKRARR